MFSWLHHVDPDVKLSPVFNLYTHMIPHRHPHTEITHRIARRTRVGEGREEWGEGRAGKEGFLFQLVNHFKLHLRLLFTTASEFCQCIQLIQIQFIQINKHVKAKHVKVLQQRIVMRHQENNGLTPVNPGKTSAPGSSEELLQCHSWINYSCPSNNLGVRSTDPPCSRKSTYNI